MLTFSALRNANIQRLPQFKNKHGQPAHSKVDGSDWSVADWLLATLGELGEFAEARLNYEGGDITFTEYKIWASKELADVTTYLDIMSLRALDKPVQDSERSHAFILMELICTLGLFANEAKKLRRADATMKEFLIRRDQYLNDARALIEDLACIDPIPFPVPYKDVGHPEGIDLGNAVTDKFNEVSERVGSTVKLTPDGVSLEEK